jgi:hypothetical protein
MDNLEGGAKVQKEKKNGIRDVLGKKEDGGGMPVPIMIIIC